jgi:hypothetical protein
MQVLLNSVNYNVARAVGPAIGGLLLSATGAFLGFPVQLHLLRLDLGDLAMAPRRTQAHLAARTHLRRRTAALRFTQYLRVTWLVMLRSACSAYRPAPSGPRCCCWRTATWTVAPRSTATCWGHSGWAPSLGTVVSKARQCPAAAGGDRLAAATLALVMLTLGWVDNLWVISLPRAGPGRRLLDCRGATRIIGRRSCARLGQGAALALYQTAIYAGLAAPSGATSPKPWAYKAHRTLPAACC